MRRCPLSTLLCRSFNAFPDVSISQTLLPVSLVIGTSINVLCCNNYVYIRGKLSTGLSCSHFTFLKSIFQPSFFLFRRNWGGSAIKLASLPIFFSAHFAMSANLTPGGGGGRFKAIANTHIAKARVRSMANTLGHLHAYTIDIARMLPLQGNLQNQYKY